MKKIALEIILILAISLLLALIYNAVSPSGLRILPRKDVKKAETFKGNYMSHFAVSGKIMIGA